MNTNATNVVKATIQQLVVGTDFVLDVTHAAERDIKPRCAPTQDSHTLTTRKIQDGQLPIITMPAQPRKGG